MADTRRRRRTRRTKDRQSNNGLSSVFKSRIFKNDTEKIDSLLSQAMLTLYGTDRRADDIEDINKEFSTVLSGDNENLKSDDTQSISEFLSQLSSSDRKTNAKTNMLSNQFVALSGDEYGTMQSFIYDAYRNRLLEQSDLHEVSSQLIELSEAIMITRDAIISPDVVEGRLLRTLKFDNLVDSEVDSARSTIEAMESKFDLLDKIKNFIVPKTLEYGTYYAYIIPYSKLFRDFDAVKNGDLRRMYGESVLDIMTESAGSSYTAYSSTISRNDDFDKFITEAYEAYTNNDSSNDRDMILRGETDNSTGKSPISRAEFESDMKNMLNNITICNDPLGLPFLEEGDESIMKFKEFFMGNEGHVTEGAIDSEHVATYTTKDMSKYMTEESRLSPNADGMNLFNAVAGNGTDGGVSFLNGKNGKSSRKKKDDFSEIRDCYIKMIEPTRVIPIEIMNTTIGYYYVMSDDITPLSGGVSSTLYYATFDEHRKESTVVDAIAKQVVKSFNKDFLMKNSKFKDVIVDCINYYNLNEKKLKFQFIPVEYMQVFKIDKDVDGHGQSMIKKSLFYAKLYLMLLLFKIMTIIINSNDIKVNYIKQSGIDKNLSNKIQEIARIKQSRQINMTDLFSYTTLINKVGNGAEMYIPVGRSGERLIETDILAGQDVQLNTELMEMLKNAYILATGVPAAIVNYLNEADFAKVIEQNHSKFLGRVINYQLDFNAPITNMYRKILHGSSNLPDEVIESFEFTFMTPKTTTTNAKSEMIQSHTALTDFLVGLFWGDQNNGDMGSGAKIAEEIKQFKILMAEDQLGALQLDHIKDLVTQSKLNAQQELNKPNPDNGDDGSIGADFMGDSGF